MKGQYINCFNNTLQQKKKIHDHMKQFKKLMQRCSKIISTNVFRTTFFTSNRAGWSFTKIYSNYTFKKKALRKISS